LKERFLVRSHTTNTKKHIKSKIRMGRYDWMILFHQSI
jgi:hypothetical protein